MCVCVCVCGSRNYAGYWELSLNLSARGLYKSEEASLKCLAPLHPKSRNKKGNQHSLGLGGGGELGSLGTVSIREAQADTAVPWFSSPGPPPCH